MPPAAEQLNLFSEAEIGDETLQPPLFSLSKRVGGEILGVDHQLDREDRSDATTKNVPIHPGQASTDVDIILSDGGGNITASGLNSIVIDLTQSAEDTNEGHTPQEETLTPSWEQPKPRSRANTFDPYPEIPQSDRHNFRITDDDLGVGGQKTKFKNNVAAIRTLLAVEEEERFATPEEQEVLSRYVGWGGLPQAFDPDNAAWTDEYADLMALLSPEEWKSARNTTLNAHYTSPTVIKAIYKVLLVN